MKNKIKKWHIALMSFMALFIAVFASLFSLRADTVDEETGEIFTDNWEISTVFYDSTIDSGVTPLTEINWDASDGGYQAGTPRVITVQINYKNDSAVTTYQAGELEIVIPNLAYNTAGNLHANLSVKTTVGANDATHTGYDWTVKSTGENYVFTNTNTIEEKSNFEGSIQIVYDITPANEYDTFRFEFYNSIDQASEYDYISHEWFEDSCVHKHKLKLQACLKKANTTSTTDYQIINPEAIFSSPNWPSYYDHNLNPSTTFWEYTSENLTNLYLVFDNSSYIDTYIDKILIYDKEGLVYTLTGKEMRNKAFYIEGNYVKIAMFTNGIWNAKGFSVSIGEAITTTYPEGSIVSNEINFEYRRTYIHPWNKMEYPLRKYASKINSYDGLGENPEDYIWVKYEFWTYDSSTAPISSPEKVSYPNIPVKSGTVYIKDKLPEGCIAYNLSGIQYEVNENNEIIISENEFTVNGYDYLGVVFIGYPKSIYNDNNLNLNITNTGQLYGTYLNETQPTQLAESSVNLNLSNYEFTYTGELYGIEKLRYQNGSSSLYYQNIVAQYGKNQVEWHILPSVRYTGDEITVRIGDDLLYTTDKNSNNIKLSDNDYYFSNISFPKLYNCNGLAISASKYNIRLFIRYKNTTEYVQYGEPLTNISKSFSFTQADGVVGFYYQIDDMKEGIQTGEFNHTIYGSTFSYVSCTMYFKPEFEIAEQGTINNFAYVNVFTKDANDNLVLINEPSLDSYSTEATERDIATYDLETYGHYMQRAVASTNWTYYNLPDNLYSTDIYKASSSIIQNAEKENFTGSFTIYGGPNAAQYGDYIIPKDQYFQQCKEKQLGLTYIKLTDLLPEGMNLISNEKEIIDTFKIYGTVFSSGRLASYSYSRTYNLDGELVFSSNENAKEYLKERTSIDIIQNYNGTNRTQLEIYIDLSDQPLVIIDPTSTYDSDGLVPSFSYEFEVPYDSYLEYGKTYINPLNVQTNFDKSSTSRSITITYVVSTHQDVTTYVKTNKSNYSTGIVDASCDSEYEYKLRVRTGSADVTNLILYTNLEEAQPNRTRWYGEFLDIDTTYAENKGYIVKPYYSENPAAGNLYNEDGILNSDWKEYIEDMPELKSNGLSITFNNQCKTENNYDYVIIYYEKGGKIYQTEKLTGANFAGKTVSVPSTDFYLYWHTDGSSCSNYGFSVDSISPAHVENVTYTIGTLPSYTATELQDDNYPDSNWDGNHPYYNYGNNIDKVWYYSYTGELPIIQEYVKGIDKDKVKSLAFEYLDNEENPATLPANSLTYVLIKMKSPADENIKTLARMDCWTQWNAIDEFDQPVDFITGINSNVVKVALPNSIKADDLPSISLKFIKEIQGETSDFENIKLNKADEQLFMIRLTSLTANDDGSYNQVTGLLSSTQGLVITQIPIGTYLLEELGDNYFDFVNFTDNNDPEIIIEGVTFEKTDQGYIITVSEDLTENIEFNIKVTNQIEPDRFYEDKHSKENLFLKSKLESAENDPA